MCKLLLKILLVLIVPCSTLIAKGNITGCNNLVIHKDNDTIWEFSYKQGVCKVSSFSVNYRIRNQNANNKLNTTENNNQKTESSNSMKGYLTYEYYYNERHTLSGSIRVNFKNKYPFTFNFSTRQTNNYFFRNFFDLGIKFNNNDFIEKAKAKSLHQLILRLPISKRIDSLESVLIQKKRGIKELVSEIEDINFKQLIVKEREAYIIKNTARLNCLPTLEKDSLKMQNGVTFNSYTTYRTDSSLKAGIDTPKTSLAFDISKDTFPEMPSEILYKKKIAEVDSLKKFSTSLNFSSDSLKAEFSKEKDELAQSFGNRYKMSEVDKKFGLTSNKPSTNKSIDEMLFSVKSFGIGRTEVNYSDLTIMNQNILGLQLEYEPRLYYAIAGGKVDYNYRDLILANSSIGSQEFYTVRVGTSSEANHGIRLSVFTGKKNNLQSNVSSKFSGFSIQYFKKLNATTEAVFEVAKTTSPFIANSQQNKGSLFNISDNTNLAYSGKIISTIKETNTKLQAIIRRVGYNFQSINFFSNYSNQIQWNLKLDQSLFKKTILITASVKQNDYSNPLIQQNFNTKTVLKSVTVTYRKRKLPFISVGYYPGFYTVAQDKSVFAQSIYYILNSSLGYTISKKGFVSTTLLNYNQFSNSSKDSAAINFSGTAFLLTQIVNWKTYSFHAAFMNNDQSIIKYNSYEIGLDLFGFKRISIGASLKCNTVKNQNAYWGNSVVIGIDLGRFAKINFNYDKQFMPQKNGTLIGANVGRLLLTKYL